MTVRTRLRLWQTAICLALVLALAALFARAFHMAERQLRMEQEILVRGALSARLSQEVQLLDHVLTDWLAEPIPSGESALVARCFALAMQQQAVASIVLVGGDGVADYSLNGSLVRYTGEQAEGIRERLAEPELVEGNFYQLAAEPEADMGDPYGGRLQIVRQPEGSPLRFHFILRESLPVDIAADILVEESLAAFNHFDSAQWVDFLYREGMLPEGITVVDTIWSWLAYPVMGLVALAACALSWMAGGRATQGYEDIYARLLGRLAGKEKRVGRPSARALVARAFAVSVVLPALAAALALGSVHAAALWGEVSAVYPQRLRYAASETAYTYRNGVQTCMRHYNSAKVGLLYSGQEGSIRFRDYQELLDTFLLVKSAMPRTGNVAFYNPGRQNVYSSVYFDNAPMGVYSPGDVARMEEAHGDYVPFLETFAEDGESMLYVGKTNYRSSGYAYTLTVAGYMVFSYDLSEVYRAGYLDKQRLTLRQGEGESATSVGGGTPLRWSFSEPIPAFSGSLRYTASLGTYLAPYADTAGLTVRALLLIGAVGVTGMAAVCERFVARPVRDIKREMYKVYRAYRENGGTPQEDEVSLLEGYFHQLVERVEALAYESWQDKMRLKELELLENQAQLRALQHQINPHFLYNTLEALKWMALKHGTTDIYDMVMAMSRLYRFSLIREGELLVTVAGELEALGEYIFLQSQRFPEKFTVVFDIAGEAEDVLIPKLILQPLVENAIEHGFQAMEEGGLICITAQVEAGRLCLTVEDNGCGMAPEDIRRILEAPDTDIAGPGGSVALSNIHARLRLLYSDCTFTISEAPGGGTVVAIGIPAGTE